MRRVVIIGGSIAGLVTARVMADHFDRVTVLDRDHFPASPAFRPGTPQAHHIHVLLMEGQYILEKLFPGLQDELAGAGAQELDWTEDCLWFGMGKWGPRFPSGMVTHFSSRALLEFVLRQRLSQNPKVEFLTGHDATGLVADSGKTRITGVQFRLREQGRADHSGEIQADLVVDASGRESKTPQWMQALGYAPPPETVINSFLGYASRLYEKPARDMGWKAILIRGTPPDSSRGGGVFPIEGNRWIANVGAAGRDYPPTDEDGFIEFVRTLPDPLLYNVLKDAKPVSPVYGYRRTENRFRHYERLARVPENLIVLGDAVCAFNPVYGQGMTVAVQGALALGEILGTNRTADFTGVARRFYKKLAQVNATPWAMAVSVDSLYPETEGAKPDRANQLTNGYMTQVTELAVEDPRVHLAFLQVLHLLKPPLTLFHPYIILQVVRRVIARRFTSPPGVGRKHSHTNPSSIMPRFSHSQRNNG